MIDGVSFYLWASINLIVLSMKWFWPINQLKLINSKDVQTGFLLICRKLICLNNLRVNCSFTFFHSFLSICLHSYFVVPNKQFRLTQSTCNRQKISIFNYGNVFASLLRSTPEKKEQRISGKSDLYVIFNRIYYAFFNKCK